MDRIKILFLEDSPNDAELEERLLKESGLEFESVRVESLEAFEKSLTDFRPDLVLGDYNLPGFTGLDALKVFNRYELRIPFIVVSGAIGEEVAVDLIKAGATDYVYKDRLQRLPTSIRHAMKEIRLEEDKKEAEDRFRIIFSNALDGIVLINKDGRIVDSNPEFEKQTGRKKSELEKMFIWELRPKEKQEAARKKFYEIYEKGEGGADDLDFIQPDGSIINIEFRAGVHYFSGTKYIHSICRDISSRIREKEKLLRTQNNLKEAQKIAKVGSWELDIQNNILTWSDEVYEMFEMDSQKFEATYEAFLNVIHPDDRNFVNKSYTDSLKNKTSYDIVHRLKMLDERIKYVREICKSFYDKNDNPVKSIGTVQDITYQYETNLKIKNLNRTLRTITTCNEALVRAKDEETLYRDICNHIVHIGGYQAAWIGFLDETDSQNIKPVYHSGDERIYLAHVRMSESEEHLSKCISIESLKTGETIVRHKLTDKKNHTIDPVMENLGIQAILAIPIRFENETYGVLTIYSTNSMEFDDSEIKLIDELAADMGYGINALRVADERDEYIHRFSRGMKNTIAAISRTIELRDPYTAGHQMRVALLASAIAKELGLPKEQCEGIHIAGVVHDIGKIQIPAEILGKPGKMTELDYDFIRTHPQAGYDILKNIESPWPIADIVLQHHERLDGSGYPRGLKNGNILIEAQILHVADVVEAMSSHRPYRASLGIDKALDEIKNQRNVQFDAEVVDVCINLFRKKGFQFEV